MKQSTYLGGSVEETAQALAIDPITNDVIVAGSETSQTGTQDPAEGTCFQNDGPDDIFYVAIHRYAAAASPRFDLFVLGTGEIQYAVPAGSLLEPATSPATLAAGAVCWSDTAIEPFSSRGPTIDGRVKPDISGQDRVSGTVYGTFAACDELADKRTAEESGAAGDEVLHQPSRPVACADTTRDWVSSLRITSHTLRTSSSVSV